MTSEAEKKAEKFLKKQAENFRRAGDVMVEHILGTYAKEVLLAGQPLSNEGLREWLQQKIAGCSSVTAGGAPELDAKRQLYEGTLRFLDSLG